MYPTDRLRVRQIERKLNIPLPSVIRYCKELEKDGILTSMEIGGVTFYTANRGDKKFLLEKRLFNIKSIYQTGLVDYLREKMHNPTIILFGSYSRGEDTEDSDIDLYVETTLKEHPSLQKYEKMLGRRIQLLIHRNIKEIPNPYLSNNIINGITLNGFIRVFE